MIRRGFYAILDLDFLARREPTGVAVELLEGGCVALQLRAKHTPPGRLLPMTRRLVSLAHRYRVPLIVNDHVPLAAMAGADAVHLGQQDMDPREARRRLHPKQRIGLSTHTLDQARAASDLALAHPALGIRYLGYGPVRVTTTKDTADDVQGLAALAAACAAVKLPVVAIGGLTLAEAAPVARAGATALAAISAVLGAADVEQASRALHRAFCEAAARAPAPAPAPPKPASAD
jgi:thiamine-phosphate pyrophosphorylase